MRHSYKKLSLFICLGIFLGATFVQASDKDTKTLIKNIRNMTRVLHFNKPILNDALSNRVFENYLEKLDPNKQFLLSEDIKMLKQYKFYQDDALKEENLEFVELSEKILVKRIKETQKYIENSLQKPIALEQKASLHLKASKRDYSTSKETHKNLWQYILAYSSLQEYIFLLQKKLPDQSLMNHKKIDPSLEHQARKTSQENYLRLVKRLLDRPKNFYVNTWLNSYTSALDPHSSFIPLQDKENFDIRMSGQLEGIGAVLTEEKGEVKVLEIVPGGAAWKQKELEAEDIILKVSDQNHQGISLKDMPVSEAVHYIRGKKNTVVTLDVRKADGTFKSISIKREVVIIEASYAKSFLIEESSKNQTFAYVQLPSFYRDFRNRKGRNASDDMATILNKLEAKNINGLILDLRNNGGGSLQDAVEISGHFIQSGPIVQIQNRDQDVKVLTDPSPSIEYSGNIIVLTNHGSASASEIVAGALQNYSRAILLGSDHTYGKGSVQNLLNIQKDKDFSFTRSRQRSLGSIKITTDKFFRIDGNSTQFKGVLPDIVVPDTLDYLDIGENKQNYALPFSFIGKVEYTKWQNKNNLLPFINRSKKRINSSKAFKSIKERNLYLEDQSHKATELSFKVIVSEIEKSKSFKEVFKKLVHTNNIKKIIAYNKAAAVDKDYIKDLKGDVLIQEAINILNDMSKENQYSL